MQNPGLDDSQAGIKIVRKNINNFRCADDITLMAESEEELKSLLMKEKEENEEAGLKLSIQKTTIMTSGSITSWQIDEETMETVRDFIFLGSKITIDDDCRREIKTLVSWRKSYDQPRQHIKKQRHYFANKGPSSQSYGLSSSHVQMWKLDHKKGWALKNWSFEPWCWRRLLRVHWTTRSNQSILKEINPEYSFEGLMMKLQYFGHLMWRADSLGKKPWCWESRRQEEKGTTEDKMVGWHHQPVDMNLSKLQEMAKLREAWCAAVRGVAKSWTSLTEEQQHIVNSICTIIEMKKLSWLFSGHEFEQTLGDSESQGSPPCCSPWGCKESDMTDWTTATTIDKCDHMDKSQRSHIQTNTFCRVLYKLISDLAGTTNLWYYKVR